MKEGIQYDKLNREEHWSKKVFRDKGITVGDVARALDLSYTYVSGMLSGNITVSKGQEERIKELVAYVEQ